MKFEIVVIRLLLAILYRQVYPDAKQFDKRNPKEVQCLMNDARDFINFHHE